MPLLDDYSLALWGILLIIVTWLAQGMVASGTKAAQPGAIPGKIDESLSHASFVFRSHRTFMNSLENLPIMLATSLLAILSTTDAFWTGIIICIFAVARIIHMTLYYAIATEVNPSPRSYFFLIGVSANIALLILCAISLAS